MERSHIRKLDRRQICPSRINNFYRPIRRLSTIFRFCRNYISDVPNGVEACSFKVWKLNANLIFNRRVIHDQV